MSRPSEGQEAVGEISRLAAAALKQLRKPGRRSSWSRETRMGKTWRKLHGVRIQSEKWKF